MGASLDKTECLPVPLPLLDEVYSVVELLDGRSLAFREYGDPAGAPIIFYHSSLSSRLFMPSWEDTQEAAVAAGARIIAVDRPGYGRSSAHMGRAYMDNGAELRALLASAEGLAGGRRVALLGHASGAPHALAAAYVTRVPGMVCQVAAVGLVSPEGPYLELGASDGRAPATPEEAKAAAKASFDLLRTACEELEDTWPDRSRLLAADLYEAARQGLGAAEQDYLLERSPWDFQLEDVDCRALLWQGLQGEELELGLRKPSAASAPAAAMARHLAAHLPDCTANFVTGENHMLVRRRWDDILAALVAEVRRAEHAREEKGLDEELSPARADLEVVVEKAREEPPIRPLRLEAMAPCSAPPLLQTEQATGPPTPLAAAAGPAGLS